LRWLDEFKCSIIEQDIDTIIKLVNNPIFFKDISADEKVEIQALLNVATKLIKSKQNIIKEELDKIEKTKNFLKQDIKTSKFDMSF
jgi:hypothetical protein